MHVRTHDFPKEKKSCNVAQNCKSVMTHPFAQRRPVIHQKNNMFNPHWIMVRLLEEKHLITHFSV